MLNKAINSYKQFETVHIEYADGTKVQIMPAFYYVWDKGRQIRKQDIHNYRIDGKDKEGITCLRGLYHFNNLNRLFRDIQSLKGYWQNE